MPSAEAAENKDDARLGSRAADASDLIRRRRSSIAFLALRDDVIDIINISAGLKMTLPDKS